MGWTEARKRYLEGATTVKQTTEDLVARRVLKGMGLVDKRLPAIEKQLFGEVRYDDALWVRTLSVFQYHLHRKGLNYVIDVYDTEPGHKSILERINGVPNEAVNDIVLLTRVKSTTLSWMYRVVSPCNIGSSMQPPFLVIAESGDKWIVTQETELWVKQHGEFTLPDNE